MNFLAIARAWLAHIDPAAPAAALIVFIFVVIYSIRRWKPTWWLWVEKTIPYVDEFDYTTIGNIVWSSWQALPAMILGAVTSAIADGVSLKGALIGAALGALTAFIHKVAAGYKGKLGGPEKPDRLFPSDPPTPRVTGGLAILFVAGLCFHTTACGVFGSHGSLWPATAKCAPSRGKVVSDVAEKLFEGGDTKAELETLAESYGASTVVCVVNELVANWGAPGKAGASPEIAAAKLRGEAFLSNVGTKVEQAQ